MLAGLLALALAALTPTAASAKARAGCARTGLPPLRADLGALTVNRVYCGLATTGEVCVDSTNSSTIGGGYWPKGTADQYNFNSGLQLAGVIGGTKPTNPWGGDTTGAFFFDPKGTTQHGQEIQPIYNSQNPEDAGRTRPGRPPRCRRGRRHRGPSTIRSFSGRVNAPPRVTCGGSAGKATRRRTPAAAHPLGMLVETRGWAGTSRRVTRTSSTSSIRSTTSRPPTPPTTRRCGPTCGRLMQAAQQFQAKNNAAFGVDLPAGGYTIDSLFAAFARTRMSPTPARTTRTVNLPFALGVTYDHDFGRPTGWTFDPAIFCLAVLRRRRLHGREVPEEPATGPGQIQLFSNTINGGGLFNDPRDTKQLFRYLSGTVSTAAGDGACNEGNPQVSRICFINKSTAADMRLFQSSTALTLPPGGFGSIVVAYIYAAPVITASITPSDTLRPEAGRAARARSEDGGRGPALATTGANQVDSLMGFKGWSDLNGNCATVDPAGTVGCPETSSGGSGLDAGQGTHGAGRVQQQVPAPVRAGLAGVLPGAGRQPGDRAVAPLEVRGSGARRRPVLHGREESEVIDPISGTPVANPLYDPNYRQFDVEGYRIYRGRVDAPNALSLIAQFDYAGTRSRTSRAR